MSQRASVDHQRIERFLRQLGQRFHGTGRIYLVGGTTMVYEGFRNQTLDIDLALELSPQDHTSFIQMVRELKEELNVNVEEASPGDFIPLPAGYKDRCQFLGRYGACFRNFFTRFVVGRMEGWKDGNQSSILPSFQVSSHFGRNLKHTQMWAGNSDFIQEENHAKNT